jgi:hypothetical protein
MRVAACKAGLPFEVAFREDDGFVLAWVVAASENEGADFNWHNLTWRKGK